MSVEQSWARIVEWLEQNAPATAALIRPPATASALADAEANFENPWPSDLKTWYALHNGAEMRVLWQCVLPHWTPLSLDQIVESSETYASIVEDVGLDEFIDEDAVAGEMAAAFVPEFVPIAKNGAASTLFVDTRSGPLSGCVTIYDRDEGALGGPTWDSVTAMLDDLADALERGRPCNGWQPTIDNNALDWQLAGTPIIPVEPDDHHVRNAPDVQPHTRKIFRRKDGTIIGQERALPHQPYDDWR